MYWGLSAQIFQQESRAEAWPQSSTKHNFVVKVPSGCSPPKARQSSSSWGCWGVEDSFVFMHSEEKEKLSWNILIHALKSTEKYSTNNKTTNRRIRKFSNRARAVKNQYLQSFMKNTEQMFPNRAFWDCKSLNVQWYNRLKFSVSLC